MADPDQRGPQVLDAELLYRAIHIPDWWEHDPPRPRSAAFNWPNFSVNIASIIGIDGAIQHLADVLQAPEGAIVSFQCGDSRGLGFDPRQEIDPQFPDNIAHANVYSDGTSSKRKTRAKQLAVRCLIVKEPSFSALDRESDSE